MKDKSQLNDSWEGITLLLGLKFKKYIFVNCWSVSVHVVAMLSKFFEAVYDSDVTPAAVD